MNMDELRSGKPVLVVGRAGLDLYADPPGTALDAASQFTAALGGSSANIAVGLAKLGVKTALVTRVSDDAVGRFCVNELQRYGVDTRFVQTEGGEARNSLALVDTMGDDTQAVLYRNGAADFEMTLTDVADLPYSDYSALITTGTVLAADPSRTAMFAAFDRAKAAGLKLIYDVDYRAYSWPSLEEARAICGRAASLCDIVIGNDVEFGVLAGAMAEGLTHAEALVQGGAQIVVYKRGAEGAITLTENSRTATGIFETKPLKPTGAGDSFMAGFIAALANGSQIDEAVHQGSAAAAITVAHVGCAPAMPTPAELSDFMATAKLKSPD